MTDTSWRPREWEYKYDGVSHGEAYEEGATAMLCSLEDTIPNDTGIRRFSTGPEYDDGAWMFVVGGDSVLLRAASLPELLQLVSLAQDVGLEVEHD